MTLILEDENSDGVTSRSSTLGRESPQVACEFSGLLLKARKTLL